MMPILSTTVVLIDILSRHWRMKLAQSGVVPNNLKEILSGCIEFNQTYIPSLSLGVSNGMPSLMRG